MSDTTSTKELYGLYVQRFGSCRRTPYQAAYYREWLDLLCACSSNEEAEEKAKGNGLYTGGAAAVAKDRIFAEKQAAEKMGWTDVAEHCDCLWGDIQTRKDGWLRTIDGFHRIFVDFMEYDDTRSEPDRALSAIAEDLKMLSKPSADFATLAAMPQFRALIDCSDEYYKEFVDTVIKAAATGHLDTLEWSAAPYKDEITELWDNRGSLKDACRQWYSQPVKPCCVRLSPESTEGKYEFIEIG